MSQNHKASLIRMRLGSSLERNRAIEAGKAVEMDVGMELRKTRQTDKVYRP